MKVSAADLDRLNPAEAHELAEAECQAAATSCLRQFQEGKITVEQLREILDMLDLRTCAQSVVWDLGRRTE